MATRQEALGILREAIRLHDPIAIFALFSGGHDSLCSTHVSMGIAEAVVHVNTGIGVEETREFVRETCKREEWFLRELHPPDWTYRDLVLRKGFPGPGGHLYPYVWLKERALAKLVRETKRKSKDRVMFVTGVRQQESARRMGFVQPIIRRGATVWVAPIWNWSKRDCNEYIEARKLPRNQVVDLLHMSGECLCGAFAKPKEIKEIELWFPKTAAKIHALEAEVEAAGKPSIWGVRPPKDQRTLKLPFMPMCVGCEAVATPDRAERRDENQD